MHFSGKKKLILSLIILAQVSQPLQAGIFHAIEKHPLQFCMAASTIALAAYSLLKRSQHPVQEEASETLEKSIKAKFNNTLEKEIFRAKLREGETHSLALRSKIFPAILNFEKSYTRAVINYFNAQHQAAIKQYMSDEQEIITDLRNRTAVHHDNKAIALFGYILSNRYVDTADIPANQPNAIINFLEKQIAYPRRLLLKNEINPRELLGTTLLLGEIAFIGYSDGDVKIMLNDADRRSLANLTYEQRDFIASLYRNDLLRNRYWAPSLNRRESKVFYSLSNCHQQHLKQFYNLHISFKDYITKRETLHDLDYLSHSVTGLTLAGGLIVCGIMCYRDFKCEYGHTCFKRRRY